MGIEALGPGEKAPNEFYVVIEIPAYGPPVKYEVDKDTGLLMVDRFMNVAMNYPANYGFVPKTLAGDGDPVDVLVLTPHPILAGSVIKCRAVAVLDTEDEKGTDAKLLAVPTDKVSNGAYDHLRDLSDVPQRLQNEIRHFYEHYKDLETGKWVKISGWRDAAAAREEITKGISAYEG
jgi:inorganic pyrophosphatase